MTQMTRATQVPPLTLGWRLRMAREWAGLDLQQLAQKVEVHRQTAARWEHDEGRRPKEIFLEKWALVTGVSYAWLSSGEWPELPDDPESGDSPSTICYADRFRVLRAA